MAGGLEVSRSRMGAGAGWFPGSHSQPQHQAAHPSPAAHRHRKAMSVRDTQSLSEAEKKVQKDLFPLIDFVF